MFECAFVIARNICLSLGAWEILQAPFSQTDNLINQAYLDLVSDRLKQPESTCVYHS